MGVSSLCPVLVVAFLGSTIGPNPVQHAEPVKDHAQALAFHDVDVFDGSRMLRRVNVVVLDGMIRAVAPEAPIPRGAQVIEGHGKTLIPGLFDSHTHLGERDMKQYLQEALSFGVTTELEMFGTKASLALRRELEHTDDPDLADFRTAGIGVTAPGGHPTQMGGTPFPTLSPNDDAQAFVDARNAQGSDYIKIIDEHLLPTLSSAQIAEIVVAAHRRNKLVLAHINSQAEANEAILAGVDGLAHAFADVPPAAGFALSVAQHHAFVIPTLTVFESVTAGPGDLWWQREPGLPERLNVQMKGSLSIRFPTAFAAHYKLENAERVVFELNRAGVPILAGTDAPAPGMAHGVSLHRELELLVASGLTPLQALSDATFVPARTFGLHDRGRVAVGLRADLVLVDGDPSEHIEAMRNIAGVWKLGKERSH